MRADNISSFQIDVCKSELYKIEFALVYPPGVEYSQAAIDTLVNGCINYYLAIRPNVPIVLFQISTLHGVGSKVYGGSTNCPPIYHLPPRIYQHLEDIVSESVFLVSQSYLEHVIKSNCLNMSIFSVLGETRQEIGLNVLGIYGDVDETDEA